MPKLVYCLISEVTLRYHRLEYQESTAVCLSFLKGDGLRTMYMLSKRQIVSIYPEFRASFFFIFTRRESVGKGVVGWCDGAG